MAISEAEGFPYPITEDVARIYCQGRDATAPGVQTYGVFEDDKLVSVMTATFCVVFPCEDSPSGGSRISAARIPCLIIGTGIMRPSC